MDIDDIEFFVILKGIEVKYHLFKTETISNRGMVICVKNEKNQKKTN